MKPTTIQYLLLALVAAATSNTVSAEVAVLTLLNNGYALETGEQCSDTEWEKIDVALDDVAQRRLLRQRRDLTVYKFPTYNTFCSYMCANFAPYHCRLVWSQCQLARRRELGELKEVTSGNSHRKLWSSSNYGSYSSGTSWNWSWLNSDEGSCQFKRWKIHSKLNALAKEVSPSCQAVLNAPRDLTCYNVLQVSKTQTSESNNEPTSESNTEPSPESSTTPTLSSSSECQDGRKLDGSGYCVKNWCNANYQCPANSLRKQFFGSHLRSCFDTIEDCECCDGYTLNMETETCELNDRQGDSTSTSGEYSPCEKGRKLVNGYCVMEWCNDDYRCPPNSDRREYSGTELRMCYNDFNDCLCLDGYTPNWDNESCDSIDPDSTNGETTTKETTTNPCDEGFKLDGSGYCVATWCNYDYQCPSGTTRKADRQCYNDENDCESNNMCESERKLDGSGYCVEAWCDHDYQCPEGMTRKDGRQCYNNEKDCEDV